MLLFTLGFLLGDLYVQTCASLPMLSHGLYLLTASLLLCVFFYKKCRYIAVLPAILAGLCWSVWYAEHILSVTLPKSVEGQPILIIGYIASIPHTSQWQTSFLFDLNQSEDLNFKSDLNFKPQVHLSWPNQPNKAIPPFKIGDEWQFKVKLKRIHGTQSPGAFDYEAFALQSNLRATGTIVIKDADNKWLRHDYLHHPIDQLRQRLRDKLIHYLPQTETAPWLLALMVGERENLPQSDWAVLRATGTNHLVAIAGLHIGSLAGFCYFIVCFLWRRSTYLTLRLPAIDAGTYAALIAAIIYSACAGFPLPTERACIMLITLSVLVLTRRQTSPWSIWSFALLVVLISNPLVVLTESMWLSFATIALLIYGLHGRLFINNWWWHWGRAQWVISIGLIPLSLTLFQTCSLVSFVANMIAIPYLTFLILPFCFLSLFFLNFAPHITALGLWIADKNLSALWHVLSWLAVHPFALWSFALPSPYYAAVVWVACLLFLLPRGMPGRGLCIVWFLPILTYHAPTPQLGEMWLSALDVGQGLSVAIQTARHTLVYDTGPNLGGRDAGEEVVLPYLRAAHINKIDKIVISHGDNDHIGGIQALLKALPVTTIKTSAVAKIPIPIASYCLAGESWEWDGVKFSFIYPFQQDDKSSNDTSCVLRVDNGKQVVLLPGDIEKKAEQALLTMQPAELSANLLIAPHHGSKTSGGKNFITAVNPEWVVFATGYRNRYHFPHPSVMATYLAAHVKTYNMPLTGTLTFKFSASGGPPTIQAYRLTHTRYWLDPAD